MHQRCDENIEAEKIDVGDNLGTKYGRIWPIGNERGHISWVLSWGINQF